jgi:GR25 family glycosyltransferase involved in LPS biosynthesis
MGKSVEREQFVKDMNAILEIMSDKLNSKTYEISNEEQLSIFTSDYPSFNYNYKRPFKYSEIGIWASNYDAWVKFLKTDKEYLLVFEDDVILSDDFEVKINEFISEMPEGWDALFISIPNGNKRHYYRDHEHDIGLPNISKLYQGNWLAGYMISRVGVEKIINDINNNTINDPVDIYMFSTQKVLNSYNLKPHVKDICDGYEEFPTTIHNSIEIDNIG